ncbi:ATP-binding protein [Streptomyces canus]|uniref:ATP-binding protein n=1 Tax=Streptomyces canus TaxID=58343 RepID=UPI002254CA2F|nr:ATP-binding protein [Streptomyces canus]MCX5256705.1 ATP-binding protein [Streptomyces canus]MCX5261820.1 ATP-binding protein [Streptomyces canus]MCX5262005.1 ATP-binding protein [Streptomyces canus]
MRVPIRHIAGHLVWSVHGSVWAVYRLHPGPDELGRHEETVQGTYVPAAVREEQLAKITHLVRSLTGAPRLFGLCARLDPGEVALRMIEGIEPSDTPPGQTHPWVENVEATLDLLDGQEMHRRTLWLAVPLQSEGTGLQMTTQFGALWAEIAPALGLRPAPVARREVTAYQEQASRVEAALAGGAAFRPARPAEIVWMIQHALHRGLDEPLLAEAESSELYGGQVREGVLHSPSYADLGQVRLHEGGIDPDLDDVDELGSADQLTRSGRKAWWRVRTASPLRRRWLQIESDGGTGYQAQLALAECPPAVSQDAADLFAQLETLAFPVDYTVDLTLVPAEKARDQVRRKRNELVDQADQYDARPTGMPSSLTDAARDLGELDARLSRTSVEVEVQSVTVLTVWGPTAAICDARARALASLLGGADYRAVRPAGLQEALFLLGLPGTARPGVVREFTQHQVSEDWALGGAFSIGEVGDPGGMFLGIDLDCGTTRPVMINVADAPKVDASASMGIVGDLGAGKSVMQKLIAEAVWARGGCAICIDRTPVREWAAFARTAAKGRVQIIDAAQAEVSIDPLRMFDGPEGRHYALSYLTLQLGIGPMSTNGEVLHHAVEKAADSDQPSMRRVLEVLKEMATSEVGKRQDAAATLAGLVRVVATNPLARMVFDPTLPPVRLDASSTSDMIVITTAGLKLPPKAAFANPEVLHQQPLEALIGRAVLYLIAALARQTAFEDPERFTAVVADELYWLTSSAEGTALIHEILHDGRKHGAGLLAASHDAEELGPDRGLMAYRALARTTDRERARRGLEFVGLDANDGELLRLVTTGLSPVGQRGREGEFLLACPRQNTGRIKAVLPRIERISTSIATTPGRRTSASTRQAADGADTGRQKVYIA